MRFYSLCPPSLHKVLPQLVQSVKSESTCRSQIRSSWRNMTRGHRPVSFLLILMQEMLINSWLHILFLCLFFYQIFQTLNVFLYNSDFPQSPRMLRSCLGKREKKHPIKGNLFPDPQSEETSTTIKVLLKQSTCFTRTLSPPAHDDGTITQSVYTQGKRQTSGCYFFTHFENKINK